MYSNRISSILILTSLLVFTHLSSHSVAGIVDSKHNLSVTGPGELKALSETRICVFCHTPHNGSPQTPLWNKEPGPLNYTLYQSATLGAVPSQPTGSSRLCLSCHDGLIALGTLLTGDISTTGEITGRISDLSSDLSDDHPVSISYIDAIAANPEIVSPPPAHPKMVFYDSVNVNIECSTCHDAHDDTLCNRGYDCKFLVMENQFSALCLQCHNKNGWDDSTLRVSVATWNTSPPDPWPDTDPDWDTVAENACQNCHMPHSAGAAEWLLRYEEEEMNCFPCHNGNVASMDVETDFSKHSTHPVMDTTRVHEPGEYASISGHVECQDCHNPHAYNDTPAEAPNVTGRLTLVDGVDLFGVARYALVGTPARYEYEVCFRCHADSAPGIPYIPRVMDEANTRLEFSLNNPSYHPVEGIGQNTDMPSLPSVLEPLLTESSIIYCSDCHDSDTSPSVGGTGPKGVHGSIYTPILRERYETTDYTSESEENYALCYRCHDRNSILANESFQQNGIGNGGHSDHLSLPGQETPCSTCHDPHGVQSDVGIGDHTHLINFDTRVVSPRIGDFAPYFTDNGVFSGSCTLVCHGEDHTSVTHAY